MSDIESKHNHLSTGFVGVSHLLPVLTDAGRSDIAYRLLLQDSFPSWLFSVRHGATTIWERWNGWTPETGVHPDASMNSFNHYSLGSCGQWLFESAAGIACDPDTPGFERVVIKPQIGGGLTSAKASYHSIRGMIVSAWTLEGGTLTLNITIPANTTAVVHLPTAKEAAVLESGQPLGQSEGVVSVPNNGDGVKVSVGSGTYSFALPYP